MSIKIKDEGDHRVAYINVDELEEELQDRLEDDYIEYCRKKLNIDGIYMGIRKEGIEIPRIIEDVLDDCEIDLLMTSNYRSLKEIIKALIKIYNEKQLKSLNKREQFAILAYSLETFLMLLLEKPNIKNVQELTNNIMFRDIESLRVVSEDFKWRTDAMCDLQEYNDLMSRMAIKVIMYNISNIDWTDWDPNRDIEYDLEYFKNIALEIIPTISKYKEVLKSDDSYNEYCTSYDAMEEFRGVMKEAKLARSVINGATKGLSDRVQSFISIMGVSIDDDVITYDENKNKAGDDISEIMQSIQLSIDTTLTELDPNYLYRVDIGESGNVEYINDTDLMDELGIEVETEDIDVIDSDKSDTHDNIIRGYF